MMGQDDAVMVEIVGFDGRVHYRRPWGHPDIIEAINTPGVSIRGVMRTEGPCIIKRGKLYKSNKSTAVAQIPMKDVRGAGIELGKDGTRLRFEVYIEEVE